MTNNASSARQPCASGYFILRPAIYVTNTRNRCTRAGPRPGFGPGPADADVHVLGHAPMTELGCWHTTPTLPPAAVATLQSVAARRAAGEPLAYLTGNKEFFGLQLTVNPGCGCPTPDTETLVEWALEVLPIDAPARVVDLGARQRCHCLGAQGHTPCWRCWRWTSVPMHWPLRRAMHGAWHWMWSVCAARLAASGAEHLTPSSPTRPTLLRPTPHLHLSATSRRKLWPVEPMAWTYTQSITQAPRHLRAGGWLLLEHGYDQPRPCARC